MSFLGKSCVVLSMLTMSSCVTMADNDFELEVPKGQQIKVVDESRKPVETKLGGISQREFEANIGRRITIEGVAVNSKPYSYVYVDYHIYIPSGDEFFWPPYLEGQRVKITGTPVVMKHSKNVYDLRNARKKYFFEAESYTLSE